MVTGLQAAIRAAFHAATSCIADSEHSVKEEQSYADPDDER